MATRLYFSAAVNSTTLTPTVDAGWNYTSEKVIRSLLLEKNTTETSTDGVQIGPWTATAGQKALDRQYISPPLAPQTISGTFKGQVMVKEIVATDNVDQLYVVVKVINSAGTVAGTPFAFANATTTLEFGTVSTNKKIADGDALTSYQCAYGDRLLIEIGYSNSTAGTTPEATGKWGAPAATADLPEDETATTVGVAWVEFSMNIQFVIATRFNNYQTFHGDSGVSTSSGIS